MTAAIRIVLRDAASFCFRIGSLCFESREAGGTVEVEAR
jgi:hypothetical protein